MNLDPVAGYYSDALARHGATPQGVDWNSADSQQLRFRQLTRLWAHAGPPASVNDYGCGFGALREYLRNDGFAGDYRGFDIVDAMVAAGRERAAGDARARFVASAGDLASAEYTVASGIFNVKLEAGDAEWQQYIRDTLDELRRLSTRGFAFNLLTLRSDPERRRGHLHYASATEMFDYCQERFSPRVAVLHDYPLYEFTVLVRLQD